MKIASFIVLALAMLSDALITNRALHLGLREVNPILRKLLGARPRLSFGIAFRVVLFVLLAFVPTPWWGRMLSALPFFAASIWNLSVIRNRG